MDKPFTKYVCDVCGKTIDAKDAVLQWVQRPCKDEPHSPFRDELDSMRICCNREACDSFLEYKAICEKLHFQWVHLDWFLGSDNIDEILTFPMERIIPDSLKEQYLEILRRLTIPYYEEARCYFNSAYQDGVIEDIDGYNKGHISWKPSRLKRIIEEYSK